MNKEELRAIEAAERTVGCFERVRADYVFAENGNDPTRFTVDQLRTLINLARERLAQMEAEGDAEKALDAIEKYAASYCQDERFDVSACVCGERQHREAVAMFEAIETLRAALSQRTVQEWMPIETAPKDGTRVLLYADIATNLTGTKRGKIATGCFDYDDCWQERAWPDAKEDGWRMDGDQCIPTNQQIFTLWQPIALPKTTDNGGV